MTATTASDPSGVQYYFANLTIAGHDSGWQDSPSYTDSGLAAATSCSYQVKARDKSPGANETGFSESAGATTLNPPAGSGALIYEPFADSDSSLTGNTLGTGLTGNWTAATAFSVASGSLAYGSLPVSGNQVTYVSPFGNSASSVAIGPALDNAGLLADGATLWFSLVVNTPWTAGSNPDTGFAIGTDPLGSGNNLPMPTGGQGLGWTIKNGKLQAKTWNTGLSRGSTGPAVATNTTMLVVGEIVWGASGAASDTINLYLPNTELNQGPVKNTQSGVLAQANFDTITSSLKTNTGYGFDEIRFGATYEDVIGAGGNSPPYATWAAGPFPSGKPLTDAKPALDFDGGGLATGIEWVTGGDPTSGSDDAGQAPTFDNSTDPDDFLFIFRRTTAAGGYGNTTITVEYGSDLNGWRNTINHGAADGVDTLVAADGFGPGIDKVTVAIPRSLAVGNKLFARLKVVMVTP